MDHAAAAAPSEPPRLQGRFRVAEELARGGMGTVFSAFDESTGARVALKRLTALATPQMAMLFEREFYVLSSLKHPRIIEVLDYGVDSEGPYYTMELLDGSDLRELSPVEPLRACRYLRDVASSLALLHARRLLHRDVSPRNVRTLADGSCKLIDFGALMSFGAADDLVGTPPSMPPEALSGQAMDQRADLFSLGTLAYYLLTGTHAFPARKVGELPEAWLQKPQPPSALAPGVPAELDQLVQALLNLDILARPSSAAEVIDRLNTIAGLEPAAEAQEAQAARSYLLGAALVERDKELDRVQRRLRRAKHGRGTAVFVDSAPGVGKSRFLAEVTLKAQLGGVTVLHTDALSHSGPLATASALVQQLFRLRPALARKVVRPHAGVLGVVWPELLSELDLGDDPLTRETFSRSLALARLPAVLEGCFREVAQKTCLLVAVDNVEHADGESAAFVMSLSRLARAERMLVVTTAQIAEVTTLSVAVRSIREAGSAIRLRELSEEGITALVRTAFGDVPHVRRTATRLFATTNGNPDHAMRLMDGWVATSVVRYTAGEWTLPLEMPESALVGAEYVERDRLLNCSERARHLAAALAVLAGPASIDLCVSLAAPSYSSREVIAAAEELVREEVLTVSSLGYRFRREALRASVVDDMDRQALCALHWRVGDALLVFAPGSIETELAAGLHFIRGADERRGAELIAKAARTALLGGRDPARVLASGVDALEAALDVYRRTGSSNLRLLDLLVPLSLASYEISPQFAMHYAGETIERLERVLGLSQFREGRTPCTVENLGAALGAAPVLEPGETTSDGTPDVVMLVGWLIATAMSLTSVASAAIDHEAEQRFASALAPFTVFGPTHPAAAAHEFCSLIGSMSEDRLADSHRRWLEFLAKVDEFAFPSSIRRRLRLGALYCLGILECQRDDDRALARLQEIESSGSAQSTAVANQLRFLYHGFRGEAEIAQRYRDQVEAYAMQRGSAWQVEIWSTCTMSAVYGKTRDAAGNRRVVEQLERLKAGAPSLEQYWERACATQFALTGAPARAAELYDLTLSRSAPRERVGWSCVRAGLAHCYNALGRHDAAKRICEETLALCHDDDEYVAMTLGLHVELCLSFALLGDVDGAKQKLDQLFERHRANENPATLGALHRAGAEIARLGSDTDAFEAHLTEMQRWYWPTKNPALIAQCDELRNANRATNGWQGAVPLSGTLAKTQLSFVQSLLASCSGREARRGRALELVATQAGAKEAWLFTKGPDDTPILVAKLGLTAPPPSLLPNVASLFERPGEDTAETAFIPHSHDSETLAALPEPPSGFRLFPLTVAHGAKHLLVGSIAVPASVSTKTVGHGFLQGVAAELFQAGDFSTVRLVG